MWNPVCEDIDLYITMEELLEKVQKDLEEEYHA